MPIPMPSPDEKEPEFMSRCMSMMADEEPNMPNEQRVAICMDKYKKSKKKGEDYSEFNKAKSKEVKRDEDGHIIVAENVKITFSGTVDFTE